MMRWGNSGQAADSFYQVRPDCSQNVPSTKFKIKAGKTLSVRKWHAAFTREGCLDIASVLSRIQRGGVHPAIRGEVWEFLLGCYDPGSTFDERDQIRHRRKCREMDSHVGSGKIITARSAPIINEDGFPIKDPLVLLEATSDAQGTSAGSSGVEVSNSTNRVIDRQIIDWKLTLHQIENLSKLWDILAVYAWIDKEVGYCQGMSDLCSPMIVLLNDEADAFWCFERLMRRLRGNFRCTKQSVGVENQLQHLASIIQVLDPKLHDHLETLGGGDYLFAFRMFMVLFRRELSFGDSLYLWEMMWALEYDPDIFFTYDETGTATHKIEGSIPKILNNVSGDLDAKRACAVALKLHRKYLKKMQGKKT
ncbi:hypothetical protein PVAP13_9NG016251 [Panicum virgatum]|uniref:Rab-GAP TBC domain-containing protein n=1 Tax=Panicum virgatum TaxID=38727 RepID=A0A8T0MCH0_PANVG|nr:hypothetical protein PVAP13_9NG016251 [Panicum virgatum]